MKVSGDWIGRAETRAVCGMLTDAGHRALFVGGCVRNALLGAPVRDIDIATDALPQAVMTLAEEVGMKPVPTGIGHGTVTVVSGGLPHEVTTFRRDVETYGRHARVSFSDDVAEDARRRDFTMNALYAEPDGTLVDPLGGLADLRARRVRFIDDAQARIGEDYLRILRFFRFHAWYGQGELDPEGLAACAALADGVARLSKERVGAEMLRLLGAPDPAPAVAAMRACGVLERVLPGADDRALAPLVHLEECVGVPAEPIRRLAALGGDGVAERLRLSNVQARRLEALRAGVGTTAPAAELGYRQGAGAGRDIVLLRAALGGGDLPAGAFDDVALGARARFPVSAADLMPALSGPELGRRLDALERRWIASRFALGRDDLLR